MPTLMFGYVGHDLLHSFSLGWFESAQWVKIFYEIKVFFVPDNVLFMVLFIFIRGHATTKVLICLNQCLAQLQF